MPKLTDHFSLEEMIFSETAVRHGINNKPDPGSRQNLLELCENILEPIREIATGPITVTSGYRSPILNSIIAGAPDSQHKPAKRLTSTARYSILLSSSKRSGNPGYPLTNSLTSLAPGSTFPIEARNGIAGNYYELESSTA